MRKKAINLECRIDDISIEALDWLDYCASDLSWIQSRWRVWESPATYDELTAEEKINWRLYPKKGWTFIPPMKKRWVDVVRFASKRDAMYFKLMFL